MNQTISQFVKNARTEANLTQQELANKVNKKFGNGTITRGHISRVEQGLVGLSINSMKALTTILYNTSK